MFQTTKYIDPLVDFAFKKIFGSDSNKDLLIDFLNEVFNGRKHIVDLIYNKNEHPGELKKTVGSSLTYFAPGITMIILLLRYSGASSRILNSVRYFIPAA